MKITPLRSYTPVPVEGVIIELNDIEAGYLRHILIERGAPTPGAFASQLVEQLNSYHFPNYEERYPRWREELSENKAGG